MKIQPLSFSAATLLAVAFALMGLGMGVLIGNPAETPQVWKSLAALYTFFIGLLTGVVIGDITVTGPHTMKTLVKATGKTALKLLLFFAIIVGVLQICMVSSAQGGEITITKHAPFVYPAEVAEMSNEDFFDWATQFNEQQVREIKRSSEPEWLYHSGVRTRYVRGPLGWTLVRVAYPQRYKNPDYIPPSPLMVINPYCKPKR